MNHPSSNFRPGVSRPSVERIDEFTRRMRLPIRAFCWTCILVLFIAVAFSSTVRAQSAPGKINFVGCLIDSSGTPVEDAVHVVWLRIYADSVSGVPLWQTSGPINVESVDGCFRHTLGTTSPVPDSVSDHGPLWVGISVGTATELRPRTLISMGSKPIPPSVSGASDPKSHAKSPGASATYQKNDIPRIIYVHIIGTFGMGSLSRGDLYRTLVDPFKPTLGVGYSLGVCVGFRNIYQLEFRPRTAGSVKLKASEFNFEVPMDFHISNMFIHRLNLLALMPSRGKKSNCLFISFGTSGNGTVKHVDEIGDGFLNGSSQLMGIEYGILSQDEQFRIILERSDVKFQQFRISGFGTLTDEIEASYWYAGFLYGFGVGL